MKKFEMGREYCTHERRGGKKCVFFGIPEEWNCLEELDVAGRILLKWIIKK